MIHIFTYKSSAHVAQLNSQQKKKIFKSFSRIHEIHGECERTEQNDYLINFNEKFSEVIFSKET